MRLPTLLPVLLATLGLPATTLADTIYRHVDKQGNLVYTDQPPDGAEEVTLPAINKIPAQQKKATSLPPAPPTAGPPFTGYQALQLSGVQDGAMLRNPEAGITVNAAAAPPLRQGDRIVIRHNGEEVSANGSYTLSQVDRGTHTFGAEIVDPNGNVLLKAKDITITVLRTSVLHPKPH